MQYTNIVQRKLNDAVICKLEILYDCKIIFLNFQYQPNKIMFSLNLKFSTVNLNIWKDECFNDDIKKWITTTT